MPLRINNDVARIGAVPPVNPPPVNPPPVAPTPPASPGQPTTTPTPTPTVVAMPSNVPSLMAAMIHRVITAALILWAAYREAKPPVAPAPPVIISGQPTATSSPVPATAPTVPTEPTATATATPTIADLLDALAKGNADNLKRLESIEKARGAKAANAGAHP